MVPHEADTSTSASAVVALGRQAGTTCHVSVMRLPASMQHAAQQHACLRLVTGSDWFVVAAFAVVVQGLGVTSALRTSAVLACAMTPIQERVA